MDFQFQIVFFRIFVNLFVYNSQNFLEVLDPFKGMCDTDISNDLYDKSLRIEPRNGKLTKFVSTNEI